MASEQLLTQIREGMDVHTADGHTLGTVAQVWYGTDPTATQPVVDDETGSRLEVQAGGAFAHGTLYVPCSAIRDITAEHVTLSVDAAGVNEQDWVRQPQWIAAAGQDIRPERADPIARVLSAT